MIKTTFESKSCKFNEARKDVLRQVINGEDNAS